MKIRNKIRISIGIILLIAMLGNAAGAFETIKSTYDDGKIITNVGNLAGHEKGVVYQLRYYQFPLNGNCNTLLEDNPDTEGYVTGSFWINYDAGGTHSEEFTPTTNGDCVVIALYHAGSGDTNPKSFKVCTKVCDTSNSIPEFATIALPIATVLGIMFILQSRKRKED